MIDSFAPLCQAASLFDMAEYTILAMTEQALFHQLLERFASTLLPKTEAIAFHGKNQLAPLVPRSVVFPHECPHATQRETRLFCDLNIRMPHCNSALADWCLTRADILKISDEEPAQFTRWYGLPQIHTDVLPEIFGSWDLDMVFLTRGADGSCCLNKSGRLLTADAIPLENVANIVGAGDSFTDMILEGLFRERSFQNSLQRASRFSSLMCTISGALPEKNDFYSEFE